MSDLSPTMRMALDQIKADSGLPIAHVFGGRRTVNALMRRAKVEIDDDGVRVYLPSHEHSFKGTIHMDGCHHFSWMYRCDCGAMCSTYSERSLAADPYSAIWMDDEGREPCQRCEELMRGARPRHRVEIVRPRVRVAS